MRWDRSTILVLALLLANATAVLYFRFFITVDGPMHLLHASVLEDHWTTPRYMAEGVIYDTHKIDTKLGDVLIMALLRLCTPEQAHAIFAVLVCCVLVLALALFLRANGTHINAALLWLAPISFSFLLVMGFFHFLLGVAVAFGVAAWWKWQAGSPYARWSGVMMGLFVAWCTHRSAPVFLTVLIAVLFIAELAEKRMSSAPGRPRNLFWPSVIAGALLLLSLLMLGHLLRGTTLHSEPESHQYTGIFLLRPLLLLNDAKEEEVILDLGVLLIVAFAAAVYARWRMGRNVFSHDAFLGLFLFFTVVPWIFDTPTSRHLFVAERCQWLALVALVLWFVAVADSSRGIFAQVIGGTALVALPLQALRLVRVEADFSHLQKEHDLLLVSAAELEPGSFVVPVMADPNWMLQHLEAYVALRHPGIFLTRNDHLAITGLPSAAANDSTLHIVNNPSWLPQHWLSGGFPLVEHILVIGDGKLVPTLSLEPWRHMIEHHYIATFDNGYARVYTASVGGKR